MAELKTRILLRSDVLANWQSINPILGKGEFAAVYDPSVSGEGRRIRVKVGDGVNQFNALPFVADYDASIASIEAALETKIAKTSETYNLPYYFEVSYAADKVTVKDYTVDLNNGEKREYSLDIAAATESQAGIMTAADKVEVNKVAAKADKTYVDSQDTAVLADAKSYADTKVSDEATIRAAADTALDERVQALEARGRFLSSWNAVTGKPETDPTTIPYELKAGDYFIVSVVGANNKQPEAKLIEGKYYYDGSASVTAETRELGIGDYYTFDGTKYVLVQNSQKTVTFANIAGAARDNANLKGEIEALEAADVTLQNNIDAEAAARIAADDTKTDKQVAGTNGTAYIFNEADGGGAKFVHNDGTESFVGVNDGGENGLVAQIYADKLVDGKWQGAKIDVKNTGIYYTVGNKSAAERDVEANEIAVKGNVSAEATRAQAAEAALDSAKQDKFDILCGGDASDWAD